MSELKSGADVIVALSDIDYEQGKVHAAARNDKREVLYQVAVVGMEEIHWYPEAVTFDLDGQLPESALQVGSLVIVKNAEHRLSFSRGILRGDAVSGTGELIYRVQIGDFTSKDLRWFAANRVFAILKNDGTIDSI